MERGAKEESEKKISRKRGRGREEGTLLPCYPLPHPLVNFFFCLHLFALSPRFERPEQAKPVATYLFLKTLVVGLADIPLGRPVLSQLSWPGYKSFFSFFVCFIFVMAFYCLKHLFRFFTTLYDSDWNCFVEEYWRMFVTGYFGSWEWCQLHLAGLLPSGSRLTAPWFM